MKSTSTSSSSSSSSPSASSSSAVSSSTRSLFDSLQRRGKGKYSYSLDHKRGYIVCSLSSPTSPLSSRPWTPPLDISTGWEHHPCCPKDPFFDDPLACKYQHCPFQWPQLKEEWMWLGRVPVAFYTFMRCEEEGCEVCS
jgi:hypothetical protein